MTTTTQTTEPTMTERKITARYPSTCTHCGTGIASGSQVLWSPETRAARHVECPSAGEMLAGILARSYRSAEYSRDLGADEHTGCRSCRGDAARGVRLYVRERGKSSDTIADYCPACVAERTGRRAAAPVAAPREAPMQSARGSICRRCGGPVADGSGHCGEC